MTNVVVLRGRVNRPPVERVLPSGDRLAAIDVTVPGGVAGATTGQGTRSESVPLAWFDAPAWAADLEPGTEILVSGRVRRRFFRAGAALQAAPRSSSSRPRPCATLRSASRCCAGWPRRSPRPSRRGGAEETPGDGDRPPQREATATAMGR